MAKKYTPTEGDLVQVEWIDSNCDSSWAAKSDIDALVKGSGCTTYGLVADLRKEGLTLCMSIDPEGHGRYGNPWFIPRAMITSVVKIRCLPA